MHILIAKTAKDILIVARYAWYITNINIKILINLN